MSPRSWFARRRPDVSHGSMLLRPSLNEFPFDHMLPASFLSAPARVCEPGGRYPRCPGGEAFGVKRGR